MSKKHPQFILAMDASYFTERADRYAEGINQLDTYKWLEEAQNHLVIRQRNQLEGEPAYRQLLPYVVFARAGDDGVNRFAAYRRGAGVGEAKLMGNVSIGFGGHIDLIDVSFNQSSVVNLADTITTAACREIIEETVFQNASGSEVDFDPYVHSDDICACILDNSNEVGQVHLGLVIVKELEDEAYQVQTREAELETLGMFTAQELLDSDYPLENWTRLILEYEIKSVAAAKAAKSALIV